MVRIERRGRAYKTASVRFWIIDDMFLQILARNPSRNEPEVGKEREGVGDPETRFESGTHNLGNIWVFQMPPPDYTEA